MISTRQLLARVSAAAPQRAVRIMNLSCHQERTIAVSGLRAVLPEGVTLTAGPGCAASTCPESKLHQALQLIERHGVTLLATETVLQQPLLRSHGLGSSLFDAREQGADVRVVTSPGEAIAVAQAEPDREMVYMGAGFETLVVPLAAMVAQGLPENLSILLCGRRVEPLVEHLLALDDPGFDALLLPGNRCALTGDREWRELLAGRNVPAAISGYTAAGVLTGIGALLEQWNTGAAQVDNCYQALAKPAGNPAMLERLDQVFQRVPAEWRSLGSIDDSAYAFRDAFRSVDALQRYPDYRRELDEAPRGMPQGCACADVVMGRKRPTDCSRFLSACSKRMPYGPCMASVEGTCYLHSLTRHAA